MAEASVQNLLAWFKQNGGQINENVNVGPVSEGGNGLVTRGDVAAGSEVASIPLDLLMNVHTMQKSEFGPIISGSTLDTRTKLLLWMIYEKFYKAEASFWAPYLGAMPTHFDTAFYFSDEELELLRGTNLHVSTMNKKGFYQRVLDTDVAQLRAAHPDVFRDDVYNMDTLRWAHTAFWSRAFSVPIGGQSTDSMIPLVDMTNHKNFSKVSWITDDASKRFHFRTEQSVAAGEQVYNNYGAKPNEEFLYNYGFMTGEPALDSYFVKMAISPADPLAPLKSEIIAKRGLSLEQYLVRDRLPGTLLDCMRVASMNELELYWCDADRWTPDTPISPRNELQCLRTLRDLVRERANRLGHVNIEKDQAMLAAPISSGGLTQNARSAIDYRVRQKEVLMLSLRMVEDRYVRLCEEHVNLEAALGPVCKPKQAKALMAWLAENGCAMDHLAFDPCAGLVASETFVAHTDIAKVPYGCLLTVNDVMESAVGEALESVEGWDEQLALQLFLMHERSQEDSKWAPWIKALPSSFATGMTLSDDEMAALEGTDLHAELAEARDELRQVYESIVPFLQENFSEVFDERTCAWDNFVWAHTVVETHCTELDVPTPDEEGDGAVNTIVAVNPLAALLASHPLSQATQRLDTSSQCLSYFSACPLQQGQPLFETLPPLPNAKLYQSHGRFVEHAKNPWDTLSLQLSFPQGHPEDLARQKVALLQANSIGLEHHIRESQVPTRLLRAARVVCLSRQGLQDLLAKHPQLMTTAQQASAGGLSTASDEFAQNLIGGSTKTEAGAESSPLDFISDANEEMSRKFLAATFEAMVPEMLVEHEAKSLSVAAQLIASHSRILESCIDIVSRTH